MYGYTLAIGTVLKEWREKKGFALSYIAEKQNTKECLLARLERGEEVDTFVLLNYIDEVYRIDPEFDVFRIWRQELGFDKRPDNLTE